MNLWTDPNYMKAPLLKSEPFYSYNLAARGVQSLLHMYHNINSLEPVIITNKTTPFFLLSLNITCYASRYLWGHLSQGCGASLKPKSHFKFQFIKEKKKQFWGGYFIYSKGAVVIPFPKIVINLSRTNEKLHCKGESYQFNSY